MRHQKTDHSVRHKFLHGESDLSDISNTLRSYFLGEGEFHGFGLGALKSTYHWPIPDNIRGAVSGLPEGDGYEANVDLKKRMSRLWKDAKSLEERERLTRFIIRDWGGIRTNSEARISAYAREASKEVPDIEFSGIASFSKVLAIREPEVYAIYDARVAVALNAVHIIGRPDQGELFPYLPGRNTVTGWQGKKRGFSTLPENARKQLSLLHPGWVSMPRKTAYQSYLTLLNSVIEALPEAAPKIYDLEMCLFSQAERLARAASPVLAR